MNWLLSYSKYAKTLREYYSENDPKFLEDVAVFRQVLYFVVIVYTIIYWTAR